LNINSKEIPYDFELERVSNELKGAKRVIVQLPDGLKKYTECIQKSLSEVLADTEIYFSMEGSFGACDLRIFEAKLLGAQAIVHFGHTEYSLQETVTEIEDLKVIFVPAYYKGHLPPGSVLNLGSNLKEIASEKPLLVASVQYLKLVPTVKEELEKMGFKPIIGKSKKMLPGQIIGCDYSPLLSTKEADSVIVISGGIFHALGAALTFSGPVLRLDPYTGYVEDLRKERDYWLKRRYAEMMRAKNATSWGIIVGSLLGQYRPSIVEIIRKEISKAGMRYYLLLVSTLNKERILNFDSDAIDAYVVTSCPRIPIDDFGIDTFPKPILTPGEALSVIKGKTEVYRFPW
jgi:2-(3-amino-3-carboxypropyl)histidine synthase